MQKLTFEKLQSHNKWVMGELIVCVVGADSSKVFTVYPLEKAQQILAGEKKRYIVVY